ncbi:MAG: sodium/solute symporter [Phycisphaeraceae bacterium]|nr:sodium/solute symporter [Phycisphaeraceae bacterium]
MIAPLIAFASLDYTVMAAYLLIVVAIGYWFSRSKDQGTENYLLGGRRMAWWLVGISYYISLLSALSLVAVPGEAYNHGVSMLVQNAIAPFASLLAFFLFVRFYFRSRVFTPYQYLEERFDVRIRLLAAGLFMMMRTLYLAVVLYASAKIFEGAADWPAWFSISLVGFIGILYTTMGGIRAVIWTDLVQFIIVVGGLVLILWVSIARLPMDMWGMVAYSFKHGRGFEYFKNPEFFALDPYLRLSFWVMVYSAISSEMFNNSSDQISIQRLLTTSSYQKAKRSLFTYIAIVLPLGPVMYLTGLAMFTYYEHHPLPEGITGDTVLFHFVATQLPAPVPGLIVAAMLAAVMSTLDSGINSLATVATKDFYLRIFRKTSTEAQQVRFSRIMTIGVGVLAVGAGILIATANQRIGQTMVEVTSLWFAFFNVLWPIFLLGVISRRVNARNILILVIGSWLVTSAMVVWFLLSRGTEKPLSFMLISVPGVAFMLVGGLILSRFSPRLPRDKVAGLTLWTLNHKNSQVAENAPVTDRKLPEYTTTEDAP